MVIQKIRLSLLLVLLLCSASVPAANALKDHPSPYLAMHGDDPVHWRDWGEAAVEEARNSGKLLFISSGYFSCHWCHVMQRESYQNADVAAELNKRFVAVKIDRELQPALDAWLVTFTEATEGRAGWPLNVFLTPDGYPLIGVTYVPQPEFLDLLGKIHGFWSNEREKAVAFSRSIVERIRASNSVAIPEQLPDTDKLAAALTTQALGLADELQGGFGEQNKFPMAPQLQALLAIQQRNPSSRLRDFLLLTFDQMANRGLRDHLAGGFFRYTVDPGWETPHYEKMLYTQAQLASLYISAAGVLDRPDYLEVAMDTLGFVLTGMRGEKGGYIASLSAVDEKGEEGGSYLWSEAELKAILSEKQWALARQWWEFPFGTQLPGMALPFVGDSRGEEDADIAETIRLKLLAARADRLPPRDTKALAGWNGLLLTALADASRHSGGEKFSNSADALAEWLLTLWDGERLRRSADDGSGAAALSDYAYVAEGLRKWGNWGNDQKMLKRADAILAAAWKLFHGDNGWRLGERSLIPGLEGEPAMQDGPLPSPTALVIALSTPDDRRMLALGQSAEPAMKNPLWFAGSAWQLITYKTEKVDATHDTGRD